MSEKPDLLTLFINTIVPLLSSTAFILILRKRFNRKKDSADIRKTNAEAELTEEEVVDKKYNRLLAELKRLEDKIDRINGEYRRNLLMWENESMKKDDTIRQKIILISDQEIENNKLRLELIEKEAIINKNFKTIMHQEIEIRELKQKLKP